MKPKIHFDGFFRGHRKKIWLWKEWDLNPLPPAKTLPAGSVMIATYSTPQ